MRDFIYYAPTKVYFGKGKYKDVGKIIKGYGYSTIMMQYGRSSIKKNGLYDEVMKSLINSGIKVIEMGGVQPNPNIEFVRKAIDTARENKVEMILGVGGGSVIDSCKYTAAGVLNEGDVWDYPIKKRVLDKGLPVGCILTISAAGSEMSSSAVITNTELNMKRGFNSEYNRCLFAICDPELTYTVDKYQTACGVVDIMAHTMERYFIPCEPTDITDRIAESILKSVITAGKTLMKDPNNYDARANMMWASSLSHNDITGCGRDNFLPVHQLEHALSGEYTNISHGAGLAVLFPAWAKYVYKKDIKRFAQFARRVWEVDDEDDKKAAEKGIECMAEFFKGIGMPTRLRDFDIPESCIEKLSDLCTFNRSREIPTYILLDYEKVKEIFKNCY